MGTRAYIGIKNGNEKISAIYNHCDGGLTNLGHILNHFVKTEECVKELISYGKISSLQDRETYEEIKKVYTDREVFKENEWKVMDTNPELVIHLMPCEDTAVDEIDDMNEVMGGMICYGYLFVPEENRWYYTKGQNLKPLKA